MTVVTRSNYSGNRRTRRYDRFQWVTTHRQKYNRCTGGSIHVNVSNALAVECFQCAVGSQLRKYRLGRAKRNIPSIAALKIPHGWWRW